VVGVYIFYKYAFRDFNLLCILHSFVAHTNLIVIDVTIAVQDDSENRSFGNIAEEEGDGELD
jgi:hypothetical protein